MSKIISSGNTTNLGRALSRGIAWAGIGRISVFLTNLLVGAILAHVLPPSEFGLVAMATVFSGFLTVFSDAGLRSAVVQFREFGEGELSTLFWASAGFSIFLAFLLILTSLWLGSFFGLSAVCRILLFLSIGLVLSTLGAVPGGILQRSTRFQDMALCEISGAVVSGAVALAMALRGTGYWALVAQSVIATGVTSLLLFIVARWRPRWTFHSEAIRTVFGFSGNLTAFNAANYWARNLDNLLIGKVFGAAELGFYNRAYTLMLYPLTLLNNVLIPVTHSVFSIIQEDVSRLYGAYLKTMRLVGMLSFTAAGVMALLAPEIVWTLWGPQWAPTVPLFRVLCVVAAIQPIHGTAGSFFMVRQRPDLVLKVGLTYILIVCGGIVIGLHWGPMGVATGYTLSYVLLAFPSAIYVVVVRVLNGQMADFWKVMAKPMLVAVGTVTTVMIFNGIVRGNLQPPVHLIVGCALALVAFGIFVRTIEPELFRQMCNLMPKRMTRAIRFLGGI